ncbi:ATP synthase subunit C lysine N-methyltransferase-like isoform X1 [Acipenser oxyrinchus oxyrinchus]|uniref:ATP synthase subunit C lysine N-methyltransferase-like isoform X1 n=1 Tax=Acipenser oxyrinchus oxyrinchus TaxID=40147 RepID=A0AAD8GHU8_ACIOX|nr:ATP synthase subunit C lysine N-methyltransferase-like isoform X1 [Acipenser oxyrinchus oxyrinchus]KAK1176419.1 ATP synthase subunit C lysine N-methyltransferase-like isoform X1 [Acipenser oxyrinchus oxyrinchus]
MEDGIEMLLLDKPTRFLLSHEPNPRLNMLIGGTLTSVYGLWAMFVLPGFRKVPFKLKVPFVPSSKVQTRNVMKLLEGRKGRLADLGSGDGRLVINAASMGFQSTGFEINSILLAYARIQARWKRIPSSEANFVNKDFWRTDLSRYNNVTAFLSPSTMEPLEVKLVSELPDDARVIVCRFPFPHWKPTSSEGTGLDQVWAYDVQSVRNRPTQNGCSVEMGDPMVTFS